MGDLGRLEEDGTLWFCGRKTHRLEIGDITIPSVPNESIFLGLNSDLINKVALVGPKLQNRVSPSLVIEPKREINKKEEQDIISKVNSLAQERIEDF